ncbi:MAG: hypothetical protein BGN88_02375 [Clostridiales bacterium 43-6]|nr:MAG: hypothetical protein BGN88_02375 [Clostridiales bacterium 43-6]
MYKKTAVFFLFLGIILMIVPFSAGANSAMPMEIKSLVVAIENAPDEAVYADLLISNQLPFIDTSKRSDSFTEKYPRFPGSELAACQAGGYVSYSMYVDDPSSDMTLQKLSGDSSVTAVFAKDMTFILYDIQTLKLAVMDKDGHILKISSPFRFSYKRGMITRGIDYHYDTDKFDSPPRDSSFNFLLHLLGGVLIMGLYRMVFSVGMEAIAAIWFKIPTVGFVVLVNLFTQVFLTVGMSLTTVYDIRYFVSVVIFEAVIFVIELVAYCVFYKNIRFSKLLGYTFTANMISFVLGLIMNCFGIFKG